MYTASSRHYDQQGKLLRLRQRNQMTTKTLRVLHIEDSEDDSLLLRVQLTRAGYHLVCARVDTMEDMAAALDRHEWDLVISDYVMPKFSAPAALAYLKQRNTDIPFIIVSGAIGEETAVAAMRAGAHDYLMKDNLARLAPAIERELQEAATRREQARAEQALRTAEKLATLGRLAATIAHEVNNPLEAVTNILYLLGQRDLDATSHEYVHIAEQELARVSHVVKQALSFSRNNLEPEPIAVIKLIDEVLNLYGPKIQACKVTVEKQFDGDSVVRAVASDLRQVISNLIVNAVDAVGSGGKVRLHVSRSRDWRHPEQKGLRIVVADDGVGIRPEHRREIFRPFFTTKTGKGTGLGLWISQDIVTKHGGSLRMRSSTASTHSGTVFSIFLPQTAMISAVPASAGSR
jgi:signal transduction histidine kinase